MKADGWKARAMARGRKEKPRGRGAGGVKVGWRVRRGRRRSGLRSIIVEGDQAPEEGNFRSRGVAGADQLGRINIERGRRGGLERIGGDGHRAAEQRGFAATAGSNAGGGAAGSKKRSGAEACGEKAFRFHGDGRRTLGNGSMLRKNENVARSEALERRLVL